MVDLGRCHGVTVVDRTATLVPRSEDHLPWHTSRVGGTETCPDPWSTLFVRTDGSTAFCTASELNLGNVNTDSFDEIWFGKRARDARAEFQRGRLPSCVEICARGLVPEPRHPRAELMQRRLRFRWRKAFGNGLLSPGEATRRFGAADAAGV